MFKHITRSGGLPVDEVTCLAQDSSGFIWLGTKEGLFRYDGFSYKSFYNIPGDIHSIPANYISKIYIDSKGLLWIITARSGIAVMKNNGQVIQVINSFTNTRYSAKLDEGFDIKEDKSGIFWYAAEGLFKLKKTKDSIRVIQQINLSDYHQPPINVSSFMLDKAGRIWLGTWKGIAIYDPVKNILYNANNNPEQFPFLNDTAYAVSNLFFDEEKDKLWYSTWKPSIRVYDFKTKTTTNIYTPEKYSLRDYNQVVYSFFRDSKKKFMDGYR